MLAVMVMMMAGPAIPYRRPGNLTCLASTLHVDLTPYGSQDHRMHRSCASAIRCAAQPSQKTSWCSPATEGAHLSIDKDSTPHDLSPAALALWPTGRGSTVGWAALRFAVQACGLSSGGCPLPKPDEVGPPLQQQWPLLHIASGAACAGSLPGAGCGGWRGRWCTTYDPHFRNPPPRPVFQMQRLKQGCRVAHGLLRPPGLRGPSPAACQPASAPSTSADVPPATAESLESFAAEATGAPAFGHAHALLERPDPVRINLCFRAARVACRHHVRWHPHAARTHA